MELEAPLSPRSNAPYISLEEAPDASPSTHQQGDSTLALIGPLKSSPPGPAEGSTSWNYGTTFTYMQNRRIKRRYFGVYKKYSALSKFVTYFILASIILALVAGIIYTTNYKDNTQGTGLDKLVREVSFSNRNIIEILCLGVGFVVVIYFYLNYALVVKWCLYWIVMAWIVMFVATDQVTGLFYYDLSSSKLPLSSEEYNQWRDVVWTAVLSLEFITLLAYFTTHSFYPFLVRTNKLSANWWFNLRQGRTPNEISYLSRAWCGFKARRLISYRGGVDRERRPHGYGQWEESSYHGEVLRGMWDHGIPVAPFISREYGTGYSFKAVRVLVVHDRQEKDNASTWTFPAYHPNGLHVGVASVECSVSGQFFKFLPSVRYILLPSPSLRVADAVASVVTPLDFLLHEKHQESVEIQVDPCNHGLLIAGHEQAEGSKTSPPKSVVISIEEQTERGAAGKEREAERDLEAAIGGKLQIQGWKKKSRNDLTALIFIPGYNSSTDNAATRIAQMVTLGDYPPYIVPVVFSWPSGTPLTYHWALRMCEGETSRAHFIDLLQSLALGGITSVHILSHSMGARLFFNALQSFEEVFRTRDGSSSSSTTFTSSSRQISLDSVILLNPDYSLEQFVSKDYDSLRRYCRHISIYGDTKDFALSGGELVARVLRDKVSRSLGRHLYEIYKMTDRKSEEREAHGGDQIVAINKLLMARDKRGTANEKEQERERENDGTILGIEDIITDDADIYHADGTKYGFQHRRIFSQKGVCSSVLLRRKYLDVDVMDTTWLDQNIHSMRHSFHEINKVLVEDIREIILTRKRARHRASPILKQGNVFTFMVAPAVVKNK